jgi:hypothetical protein
VVLALPLAVVLTVIAVCWFSRTSDQMTSRQAAEVYGAARDHAIREGAPPNAFASSDVAVEDLLNCEQGIGARLTDIRGQYSSASGDKLDIDGVWIRHEWAHDYEGGPLGTSHTRMVEFFCVASRVDDGETTSRHRAVACPTDNNASLVTGGIRPVELRIVRQRAGISLFTVEPDMDAADGTTDLGTFTKFGDAPDARPR